MLNNLFFTIVFFILDHFIIVLIFNAISLLIIKYAYNKWHNKLLSPDVRYLSLIIFILLIVMLMLFLVTVIYVVGIFIIYFHEIGRFTGKW
jgi:hypothetical protein